MNACASPETLERLMAGTASDVEADTVRRHVAGCPQCQARLDQLSENSELRQWAAARGNLTSPMPREADLGDLLK